MAIGRANATTPATGSVYDTRGIVSI